MSKDKVKNSVWYVLGKGIKIYFSNIDKFVVYMLFPVFGQILGLVLCFGLTLGFSDKVAQKAATPSMAIVYILLLALPGLLIFFKAFWDYMVAYVALNSMTEGAWTTGRVYDFRSHNEVATRRTGQYIAFLLIVGFLSLCAVICSIIPIFGLIPPVIIWIYLILVFQIFTFEPELSPRACFRRSFELVKGDWGRTFVLMLVLVFFSIYIITQGVTVIFDYLHLTDILASNFDFIGNGLPLHVINRGFEYLNLPVSITVNMISVLIMTSFVSVIVSEFTLPIRSICYSLWYKNLSEIKVGQSKISTKKYKKTVSKNTDKDKE